MRMLGGGGDEGEKEKRFSLLLRLLLLILITLLASLIKILIKTFPSFLLLNSFTKMYFFFFLIFSMLATNREAHTPKEKSFCQFCVSKIF